MTSETLISSLGTAPVSRDYESGGLASALHNYLGSIPTKSITPCATTKGHTTRQRQ